MHGIGTLIAEIVAFLVLFFLLYRYAWPHIRRMMEQRQDAIQQQVDESEEAARRLRDAEQRYESALAEANAEAARIRDDSRADAQAIREQLREQAEREVERIRQRGEDQLVAQREQTVRHLRAEIGGLSMQLAERLVVEHLSDDDRRRAGVDGFLDELDAMTRDAGEQRAAAPAAGGVN